MENVFIGKAAWALNAEAKPKFPAEGSHLERYAQKLSGVEINTSFYRDHMASSYRKWAAATPVDFKFSVKLSKVFTHEKRFEVSPTEIEANLQAILELGEKLGALLVQLPPSLRFDYDLANVFFENIRHSFAGPLVCEPRHLTWIERDALELFRTHRISKVIADPEPCAVPVEAEWQCGDAVYIRLHGSPKMYYSKYSAEYLAATRDKILQWQGKKSVWCIFDNTAEGHAIDDALDLQKMVDESTPRFAKERALQSTP